MAHKKSDATLVVAAFKGFDKDLKCRGFQFEVGQTYTHTGKVVASKSGFHACTDSWDVLKYYGFGEGNRFCRVTLAGDMARENGGDSKVAAGVLTVGDELTFGEFVAELVAHVVEDTAGKGDNPSGNYAQIGSSSNYAQIGSSGDGARIGSSGYVAQIELHGSDAVTAVAGWGTWYRAENCKLVEVV